jgi:O-antigen biosynthesis protein
MFEAVDWKAYSPAWLPTPALVADIELTGPISPITLGSMYRAARLLVRVHGLPVGYVDIANDSIAAIDRDHILASLDADTNARALNHLLDDLMAGGESDLGVASSLAAVLDRLASAQSPCAHTHHAAHEPAVTVAICTRDRSGSIGSTLDSLLHQEYRNYEIVVVDNAPSDNATEQLIRTSYPRVRYVRESRPGLDWARNRAIHEARGEILAYIDDDAIADRLWVRSLVAAFDSPEVMCVTGLVAPARLDTPAQELFERFGYSKGFSRLHFNMQTHPPTNLFPYKGYHGTGCNSAFRRSVFEQVGLFDPRLDMGTPVPGGGDHDMFTRIIRAGFTLCYDPAPLVFHDHIADMRTLARKLGQYQQSFIAYLTKCALADRPKAIALLADTAWSWARKLVRGLAAVAFKHDRPISIVFTQAFYALLGPLCLYRSHRQAQSEVACGNPAANLSEIDARNARPADTALLFEPCISKDSTL